MAVIKLTRDEADSLAEARRLLDELNESVRRGVSPSQVTFAVTTARNGLLCNAEGSPLIGGTFAGPDRPGEIMLPRQPAIGMPVHYVAFGTPGGEYPKTCRAAFITEITDDPAQSAGLCVLNPTGMFFNLAVPYDPGTVRPVERHHTPGERMPLITCADLELTGGTWHWPAAPDAGCLPG